VTGLWAWLDGLGDRRELAFWIGVSVLLHTLGALLAWRFRRPLTGRLGAGLSRLRHHWTGPLLLEAIRLAYFLLLPYLIIVRRGVLELQTLGLLGPADPGESILGWGGEWIVAAGRMATVGLAGALALWWTWSNFKSRISDPAFRAGDPGPILRETVYLEIHWAFYRAAPLVWLASPAASSNQWLSWAVLAGFAIVGLEAALDPRAWAALRDPAQASRPLVNGLLCWLSALGFALTRNLWLIAAVHAALAWGSMRWLLTTADRRRPAADTG